VTNAGPVEEVTVNLPWLLAEADPAAGSKGAGGVRSQIQQSFGDTFRYLFPGLFFLAFL
jgi:hypothetical protein